MTAHQDANKWRLARALEEADSKHKDAWEYVDPARMDSRKAIALVRRFKSSHLDRFYRHSDSRWRPDKSSILTWRQWYAGRWYREEHNRAGFGTAVISSYGERTSGGEPAYGMPRTQRQADARSKWREARQQFSRTMVGFMDRFLIHDEMPKYGGGKCRMKGTTEIAFELDALADWLRLGTND